MGVFVSIIWWPLLLLAVEPFGVVDEEATLAAAAYNACVVNQVRSAQSGVAANYLQQACRAKFAVRRGGVSSKSATGAGVYDVQAHDAGEELPFYDCLLTYLPGVHNDQSANAVREWCKEQFYPDIDRPTQEGKQQQQLILQLLGLDKRQAQQPVSTLTLDGDAFTPLTPWQGGQK